MLETILVALGVSNLYLLWTNKQIYITLEALKSCITIINMTDNVQTTAISQIKEKLNV